MSITNFTDSRRRNNNNNCLLLYSCWHANCCLFYFVVLCCAIRFGGAADAFQIYGSVAILSSSSSSISLGSKFSSIQSTSFLSSTALLRVAADYNYNDVNDDSKEHTLLPCSRQSSSRQRRTFLDMMGKGDGKTSKKKKKPASSASTPPSASSSSQPSPPPQRVTTQINIPIKRQIQYAQMHKAAQSASNPGFRQKKIEKTKYRRTWDEEEILEKAEERKRKGQDPDWAVILNRTSTSPLMVCYIYVFIVVSLFTSLPFLCCCLFVVPMYIIDCGWIQYHSQMGPSQKTHGPGRSPTSPPPLGGRFGKSSNNQGLEN
jgi:hypothetical protein